MLSDKEGIPTVLLMNDHAFVNEEWMRACPAQGQILESSPSKAFGSMVKAQGTSSPM
jgi:hypothetical protein